MISPLSDVHFSESALFWMVFYFSLLGPRSDTTTPDDDAPFARIVDAFNRSKTAYLSVGGTGAYRLDYWFDDYHYAIA